MGRIKIDASHVLDCIRGTDGQASPREIPLEAVSSQQIFLMENQPYGLSYDQLCLIIYLCLYQSSMAGEDNK
jgi:hypothetical protein